jgi:NAD(P)H dehydrogenase (quinone)
MMLPLLHHGMLLVGIPYTEQGVNATGSGGGPYGASHVGSQSAAGKLSDTERDLAQALGRRVAEITARLNATA